MWTLGSPHQQSEGKHTYICILAVGYIEQNRIELIYFKQTITKNKQKPNNYIKYEFILYILNPQLKKKNFNILGFNTKLNQNQIKKNIFFCTN